MAEARLYSEFLWRRRYLRLKAGKKWLVEQMLQIVTELGGDMGFKASMGWCSRYCKRWNISSQCRTNKHKDGSENHPIELWQKQRGQFKSVGPDGETYNF